MKKEEMLIKAQTRDALNALNSCLQGFTKMYKATIAHLRYSIEPARINSDVIEVIFCQNMGVINEIM